MIQKAKIAKVDTNLGLVFGYAIVCEVDGEPYYDNDSGDFSEHIPPQAMLEAAADYAKGDRVAKAMHEGEQIGTVPFIFPMTAEIAKALDITVVKTGLLIGMAPTDEDVLAKCADGTYTGFSIGGERLETEAVE